MNITRVGVDIAKSTFHIHAVIGTIIANGAASTSAGIGWMLCATNCDTAYFGGIDTSI